MLHRLILTVNCLPFLVAGVCRVHVGVLRSKPYFLRTTTRQQGRREATAAAGRATKGGSTVNLFLPQKNFPPSFSHMLQLSMLLWNVSAAAGCSSGWWTVCAANMRCFQKNTSYTYPLLVFFFFFLPRSSQQSTERHPSPSPSSSSR